MQNSHIPEYLSEEINSIYLCNYGDHNQPKDFSSTSSHTGISEKIIVNERSYLERKRLAEAILNRPETSIIRKQSLQDKFWVIEDEPLNLTIPDVSSNEVENISRISNRDYVCPFVARFTPSPISQEQQLNNLVNKVYIPKKKSSLDENILVVKDESINFTSFKMPSNVIENKKKRQIQEYVCHVCGKLLVGRNQFSSHLSCHSSKKYKCEFCNRQFSQSCSLKYHVRTHTGENPFVCQICSKSFKALANLNKHKAVHSETRPFECLICAKRFKSKYSQEIHTKKHYSVSHTCKFCFSVFESRKSLNTHTRRKHGDKISFSCPQCKKSYQYAKHLEQHMNMHSDTKPYSCVICGASYVWRSGLESHKKTHNFKLQCEYCNSPFTSLKKLEKHRLQHSNSHLHQCTKCERSFKFAYLLKRHITKHKEELSCTVCKLGFITKTKMKLHMKQENCQVKYNTVLQIYGTPI